MTSAARLVIDESSFVPLTEQIRRAISEQVACGTLSSGDRLPTVRQLARDLAIAPGTVAKAYQALEADGVVRTRGRLGTFITDLKTRTSPAEDALQEAARRYLADAQRLGKTPSQALTAVRDVAARLTQDKTPLLIKSGDRTAN